jgi:hypothetical protein
LTAFLLSTSGCDTDGSGKSGATVDLPKTGQTASYAAGDDGAYQKGVQWPSPRFTNPDGSTPISDNVVLDRLTGLVWTQDANIPGPTVCNPGKIRTWDEALKYVACLNGNEYLGYADWRLPNINELGSLMNYAQSDISAWLNTQGFSNVQPMFYWTSTTYGKDQNQAWYMRFNVGWTLSSDKTNTIWVWPVRSGGGENSAPAKQRRTGQTTNFGPADDGECQKGVSWPSPRFTNVDGSMPINGDVVVDQLTGLVWTKDGNAPGPPTCSSGTWKTWRNALDYVTCLNSQSYSGYRDWRLPNVNELASLINAEQADTAFWLNSQGFINVQAGEYWSSTKFASNTIYSWRVHMVDGIIDDGTDTVLYYVWPVRGGD